MENQVMIEQENLLYSKLSGQTKRDYFVDAFVSRLCFALKDRRLKLGITQTEVAKAMGVKQSYVSKVENFEKIPTIETIAKYCFALNVTLCEIETIEKQVITSGANLPAFDFHG